ncbi:MAG: HAMP domain-containing protein [Treponema sp.]|nr:HAMP domain-containing protein [Treponema sp.]
MSKQKNGKLFLRIAGIIAASMVVLSMLETVIVVENTRTQVEKINIDRYVDMATSYSTTISKKLEEYMARLDYYVNADVVATEDDEQIVEWLRAHENKRSEDIDYVAWVNSNGDFYSDIGTQTNILDRDYFQAIMFANADMFIDNPVSSKNTGKSVIHIARPVKTGEGDQRKTFGFFCAVINIEHLSSLLDDIKVGNGGAAFLFSGNSKLISKVGAEDMTQINIEEQIDSEHIKELVQNVNGTVYGSEWSKQGENGAVLHIYTPIKYTRWNIALLMKKSVIMDISTKISNFLMLFSVLLLITVALVAGLVIFFSIRPLKIVESSIKDISTGNADLTKRIKIKKDNSEIGRVVDGFNQFSEKLQMIMSSIKATKDELVNAGEILNRNTEDTSSAITEIIANIESMGKNINIQSDSVHETAGAVNQIAGNIESLNRMIESQASAVTQASASVEEMIANINSVNNSVKQMADEFEKLTDEAIVGLKKQDDVSSKIDIITNESKSLQEANAVISSIASQTNLLAMNAAIEAAHAGDAGKGFAVVADEIRKLSENSTVQSKTIGVQLKNIVASINEMVHASTEAKNAFTSVSNRISQTNELVHTIANSMEEQREGSKQISEALSAMNSSTSEVKTSSYEMSEGNKAILMEIQKLQDATFTMRSGMDEMSVGATQINRTGSDLSDIANKIEQSISQIGQQVDQFKV